MNNNSTKPTPPDIPLEKLIDLIDPCLQIQNTNNNWHIGSKRNASNSYNAGPAKKPKSPQSQSQQQQIGGNIKQKIIYFFSPANRNIVCERKIEQVEKGQSRLDLLPNDIKRDIANMIIKASIKDQTEEGDITSTLKNVTEKLIAIGLNQNEITELNEFKKASDFNEKFYQDQIDFQQDVFHALMEAIYLLQQSDYLNTEIVFNIFNEAQNFIFYQFRAWFDNNKNIVTKHEFASFNTNNKLNDFFFVVIPSYSNDLVHTLLKCSSSIVKGVRLLYPIYTGRTRDHDKMNVRLVWYNFSKEKLKTINSLKTIAVKLLLFLKGKSDQHKRLVQTLSTLSLNNKQITARYNKSSSEIFKDLIATINAKNVELRQTLFNLITAANNSKDSIEISRLQSKYNDILKTYLNSLSPTDPQYNDKLQSLKFENYVKEYQIRGEITRLNNIENFEKQYDVILFEPIRSKFSAANSKEMLDYEIYSKLLDIHEFFIKSVDDAIRKGNDIQPQNGGAQYFIYKKRRYRVHFGKRNGKFIKVKVSSDPIAFKIVYIR
jgi:hypothetical protein